MHELALWLAAGVLNVRAERSIRFPEQQEIGELRLNFVRLAEGTGRPKRLLIKLSPVAAGSAALWAIAVHIFQWEELLGVAAAGSIDGVVEALSSLMRTADVWLWFYLAFVIANTMFPTLSRRSDKREKVTVFVAGPLLALVFWRLGGAANPAVEVAIEGLMSSVGLVMAQVLFVTVLAVFALGIVEAAIERVSNRSVSFRDGKMMTMSRAEAKQLQLNRRHGSQRSQNAQPKPRPARSLASIYDIKLPIPGPPGREPVSRSAISVVNLDDSAVDEAADQIVASESEQNLKATKQMVLRSPQLKVNPPPAPNLSQSRKTTKATSSPKMEIGRNYTEAEQTPADGHVDEERGASELAPFVRPFVSQDSGDNRHEDWYEDLEVEEAEPFARPFVMASRASLSAEKESASEPKSVDRKGMSSDAEAESTGGFIVVGAVKKRSQTRPAPKPSRCESADAAQSDDSYGSELEYEALDDEADNIDDGKYFDDAQ